MRLVVNQLGRFPGARTEVAFLSTGRCSGLWRLGLLENDESD